MLTLSFYKEGKQDKTVVSALGYDVGYTHDGSALVSVRSADAGVTGLNFEIAGSFGGDGIYSGAYVMNSSGKTIDHITYGLPSIKVAGSPSN